MENFNEIIDFESETVYDGGNHASNGGIMMTSREAISAALKATGMSQAEAATRIGWSPQQLSGRLTRNSLRADEFLELMDAIGVEMVMKSKETGEDVKVHIAGAGRRVKGMVDRVIYDTASSDALANSFFEDGENEYGQDGTASELYIDRDGRYFFAEYSRDESKKDRIVSASASVAAAFIEKYGTDLHRGPVDPQ